MPSAADATAASITAATLGAPAAAVVACTAATGVMAANRTGTPVLAVVAGAGAAVAAAAAVAALLALKGSKRTRCGVAAAAAAAATVLGDAASPWLPFRGEDGDSITSFPARSAAAAAPLASARGASAADMGITDAWAKTTGGHRRSSCDRGATAGATAVTTADCRRCAPLARYVLRDRRRRRQHAR